MPSCLAAVPNPAGGRGEGGLHMAIRCGAKVQCSRAAPLRCRCLSRAPLLLSFLPCTPLAYPPPSQEFSGEELWGQFAPVPEPVPTALAWLRTIVKERMCAAVCRQLLVFTTGLHAIPSGGLRHKINVLLEDELIGQLPTAHTCALALRISVKYDSIEQLFEKLMMSISETVAQASHGEGFQMA